jgi:3-phosphoglycerate kinase
MMRKGGFSKRTVRDVPLHGKTVLLRADYNVPLGDKGEISDDFRIISSLPTIEYLLQQQCKIIICSHLGRPDGQVNDEFTLEPVAERLGALLKQHIAFVPECIGDRVHQAAKRLRSGQILMLENLRFHAGEESNDEHFAKALATDSAAEYMVQDGFGVVHRAHASTSAVTHYVPSVAGLLLEKEYLAIHGVMDDPKRPMVAVLGGAKISDKIAVIEKFVNLADTLVIGGAMANTFLKYRGYNIGKSVHEDGLDGIMKQIYDVAEKKVGRSNIDDFIVLPTDVVVAKELTSKQRRTTVSVDDVEHDELILDMGYDSIATAAGIVGGAKTVAWNGTLGYAELPQFAHGSARIALTLATNPDITSVIGGGDTADFVLKWDAGKGSSFSHVSTGGGASLDLMAGTAMPGIDALLDV